MMHTEAFWKKEDIIMRKTCFFVVLLLALALCASAMAWSCTECGQENQFNFCNKCGAPRPDDSASAGFCGMCGKSLTAGDVFCPYCGHDQNAVSGSGSGAGQQYGNPWPVVTLTETQVYFHPSGDRRVQSYCGPGDYHGAGAYKTMKMRYTYALFTDGNYTYVDMDYMTVGHRRVYFRNSAYPANAYVPAFNYAAHPATLTQSVTPMFGPGGDYDSFGEASISAGTSLSVFFEEDGYVFCEFNCKLGAVRAWIPAGFVQAK